MNERRFQQLSHQIRAGDKRGMQYVFEQSSRYCVGTLIKKTGCEVSDAEDLFMDAILIFRENILSGKLSQLSNLRTYVFGICWNLWRDLNRARTKWQREQNEVEHQLYLLIGQEEHPFAWEDQEEMKQQIQVVSHALDQLSHKCKELLSYVYVEQRPQKEIATLMGFASSNVVKVTRHRCYQQWVKHIENSNTQWAHGR